MGCFSLHSVRIRDLSSCPLGLRDEVPLLRGKYSNKVDDNRILILGMTLCPGGEMVDAQDLKSCDSNIVPVQVRPGAPPYYLD